MVSTPVIGDENGSLMQRPSQQGSSFAYCCAREHALRTWHPPQVMGLAILCGLRSIRMMMLFLAPSTTI